MSTPQHKWTPALKRYMLKRIWLLRERQYNRRWVSHWIDLADKSFREEKQL